MATIVGVAAVAVVSVVGVWRTRSALVGDPPGSRAHRAVIVDQLDLTAPGAAFVAEARRTLEASGYALDVIPALDATVEVLRDLPARQPDVLILRMHGARIASGNRVTDDVALFTGEPVDLDAMPMVGLPAPVATAVAEARAVHSATQPAAVPPAKPGAPRFSADELHALVPMVYAVNGRELPYIGLRPTFIAEHTIGRFAEGTVVVLMGCDTVRSPAMAEAFRARGAGAVVGWDGAVSAAHTDAATLALLARWAASPTASGADAGAAPDAVGDAVDAVNADLGPDPASGARLVAVGGASISSNPP